MTRIRKSRQGVVVELDDQEAAAVRALMEQLLGLLGDPPAPDDELAALGISDSAETPDDPVLARLFPDAYQGDGEAADEFRRYTEMGLRDGKREAARTVLSALDDHTDARGHVRTVLDEKQSRAWLTSLNDLRLTLGTRLNITEDRPLPPPGDPLLPLYAAYDWLTMLQDDLVNAVH
ncbi:DUF2017 domain-containing protein [Actinomadura flavalba]|uniref:DUF2017 domain-containing protein n=1 Tax=Actinomadura flavalba TaxID=1120938 RepID=UPI00035C51B7|nr:DUF2017 domain-containing protein [Actinomadura flavalba]